MSSLSDAYENIKKVLGGEKDLFNRESVMGKLDLGGLRQWHRLTGGKETRTEQLRRYGRSLVGAGSGAVTGARTGGPYGAIAGAIAGGVRGYQKKEPFTAKSALTSSGEGAILGYGLGSGISAATGQGAGWTMGLGGGGSQTGTTGARGAESTSAKPAAGFNYSQMMSDTGKQYQQSAQTGQDETMQRLREMKRAREEAAREAYGRRLNR